jgi:hypothetical protein
MAIISTTSITINNKGGLQLSQERMKVMVAIMGIVEIPTIDIGPRLRGNNALTTSCWIDDFLWSPQGCTSQHEYSFVGVAVDKLYPIRVTQYITFI